MTTVNFSYQKQHKMNELNSNTNYNSRFKEQISIRGEHSKCELQHFNAHVNRPENIQIDQKKNENPRKV